MATLSPGPAVAETPEAPPPEARTAKRALSPKEKAMPKQVEEAARAAPKAAAGFFNLFKGAKRESLFAELDRAIDEGNFEKASEIKERIDGL